MKNKSGSVRTVSGVLQPERLVERMRYLLPVLLILSLFLTCSTNSRGQTIHVIVEPKKAYGPSWVVPTPWYLMEWKKTTPLPAWTVSAQQMPLGKGNVAGGQELAKELMKYIKEAKEKNKE